MTPVTTIAPIKLAKFKTQADLIIASHQFQVDFVAKQEAVLRRELVRTGPDEYLDIIQFSSEADALKVLEAEIQSPECQKFMSVMDLSNMPENVIFYPSLQTFVR